MIHGGEGLLHHIPPHVPGCHPSQVAGGWTLNLLNLRPPAPATGAVYAQKQGCTRHLGVAEPPAPALIQVGGLQGALKGWVPLCEAIVSWHAIRCEGLRHELAQIMQAFQGNLAKVGLLLCAQPACRLQASSLRAFWAHCRLYVEVRTPVRTTQPGKLPAGDVDYSRRVAERGCWPGSSLTGRLRCQLLPERPRWCRRACVAAQLGQWDRHMNALQPAVREKLKLMCQLQ